MRIISTFALFVLTAATAHAGAANTWSRLEKAVIEGRRWDVPLGYDPAARRFIVLGGRSTYGDYRKPRSYDVLTLTAEKVWENTYPVGKDWGPKVGAGAAPAWKGEAWGFRDLEGNTRPNWTIYGTFSLGQKFDYDPDSRAFIFYAGGSTFRYEPATRRWIDLAPPTHPEKELGGTLLWSSMAYDAHNKQFVLFGGGNVQSERGDPGTWVYSPARNTWTQLKLDRQPPPRANSRLVYDPVNKKVVLFGGDRLDQLLSDTWLFDAVTQTWSEAPSVKSAGAPAPRAGHGLVWLPKAKRILLIGGYTYTSTTGYVSSLYQRLPPELWTFDAATGRWTLHHRPAAKEGPDAPANFFWSAAAGGDDEVLVLGQNGAWTCTVDVSRTVPAGGAVKPGTVTRRTGPHDPAWYTKGWPAAVPGQANALAKDLPANEWRLLPTPNRPLMNMDWGSAVFAPEHDKILRFSGGHSAYSGTAPVVYDVDTDRYALPFAPEYPIEYVYSNDQVRGEWSFQKNPWMTGHTYKSTGYDPNLKAMVFAPHDYTYFFDPKASRWSRTQEKNPWQPNFYVVTVCATPKGAVVWAYHRKGGPGLWRLDAESRTFKPLPLKGEMPQTSADHHGMAYDSRRNRLLLFSDLGKNKGDVLEYDFKSGATRWLGALGKEPALAQSRETIYIPEADAVLIGAHIPGGSALWPMYDCASNTWVGVELKGADPVGKKAFNNSMGLMHDPNRSLIWAVGQHSHVHVLKLDAKTATRKLR